MGRGAGQYPPTSQGGPRVSDRSSVSSRASSTGARDSRPQSAYYDPHRDMNTSQDPLTSRPRSEDVSASKLREWQDKYDPGNSPPYSNVGPLAREPTQQQHNPPKPTAHQRLFSQPTNGAQQKINNMAQNRQLNFYENTAPLQQEAPPAFHQLQRPPSDGDVRPRVAAKPAGAAKRNQPRVPPVEVPQIRVDNRQTQPHFYGNRQPAAVQPANSHHPPANSSFHQSQRGPDPRQVEDQRNGYDPRHVADPRNTDPRMAADSRNGQDPRLMMDPRNGPVTDLRNMPDPRNDPRHMSDSRNMVNPHAQPDPRSTNDPRMPSNQRGFMPQNDLSSPQYPDPRQVHPARGPPQVQFAGPSDPHELPPPPQNELNTPPGHGEEYQEELPPLPPPPSQEDLVERKIAEEQHKLMQSISATNQLLADKR